MTRTMLLYTYTQIGTWSSSKRAVLFGNILSNSDKTPIGGSLEGRKLRVVVTEVLWLTTHLLIL